MTGRGSFLAEYGPRLLGCGYPIVPIRHKTKHPGFKGWQKTRATQELLDRWLSNGFTDGGVGVLTRDVPAIDLDVRDQAIVDRLIDWCERRIGSTVQRVGESPKTLLVYRTQAPFTKIASNKYVDFLGLEHKVEILGDGQQFVAYAEHPDTGKPYEWVSKDGLADIALDDLPLLTAAQAQALVAHFESTVPDDWELIEHAPPARSIDASIPEAERVLANVKPKIDVSASDLGAALTLLDPDMSMHEWVRIGMALHHQYDGTGEGFRLWDEWSGRSVKYEPGEMRTRWRSFKADLRGTDPVTAATILGMAKRERRKDDGKSPLGRFVDRYVFIEHGNLVCDLKKPPHCAVSRLEEFRNSTANVRHEVPAPTKSDPDRIRATPVHAGWLTNRDRKSAQGVRYDPAKPRLFQEGDAGRLWWVNEFYMPEFGETGGSHKACDTAVFHNHMDYLFPAQMERAWFIDWIAFNLQFPERRCKVTPLHISIPHGTGRGWVVELMGRLLGQWNCTKTKMNTLCGEGSGGGFQDFLNKSLLCAVEEVRESKRRYAVSDHTRDVLTENHLEVNVKFGSKKTQAVFTNFFFMSNHPDALVLTQEDRRINVLSGPDKARGRDYYIQLYAWLETDGVAAFHREMMRRDLTGFDWQHSMRTPARMQMILNNRTQTETLFHELMAEPPFPAMTFAQIIREMVKLSEADAFDTEIDAGQLRKLLQHSLRQAKQIRIGGRKGNAVRPWIFDVRIEQDVETIREAVETCGL